MEPMTIEVMKRRAPAIFAETAYNRTEKYTKIPTFKIVDAMAQGGFYPVSASQRRTIKEGREVFAKHMIKFRAASVEARAIGDQIPEIILINSHDGSGAYKMFLGVFRLVCLNGLIVSDATVEGLTVRHSGGGDMLNRLIVGAQALSARGMEVMDVINQWKARELGQDGAIEYARGALALYSDKADSNPAYLLHSRRYADKMTDLWTVFNKVQENMIKGGFFIREEGGQYRRARIVNSIDRNVKLNRGLWEYTANFKNN